MAVVNWNEDRWVLNWNWLDNDFNGNYRVVAARNLLWIKNSSVISEEFG